MRLRRALLFLLLSSFVSLALAQDDGETAVEITSNETFCLTASAALLDEPCANGTAKRGPFPAGTRFVYAQQTEPIKGCDDAFWLPVYEGGVAAYTNAFDTCEPAAQRTSDAKKPPVDWVVLAVVVGAVFIIVVPICIAVACVRSKTSRAKRAASSHALGAMGGGGGGGGIGCGERASRRSRGNSVSGAAKHQNSTTHLRRNSNAVAHAPQTYADATPVTQSSSSTFFNGGATVMLEAGRASGAGGGGADPVRQYQSFLPHQLNQSDVIYWGTDQLIPYSQLRVEKEIGRGGYGKVYRAQFGALTVAVKSISEGLSEAETKNFRAEAKLLAAIPPHDNVVKFVGLTKKDDKVLVVMEFLDGGSLIDLIESSADYGRREVLAWLRDVAKGMIHLMAHNVLHRDLAARNIMLTSAAAGAVPTAKVTDFGMSRKVEQSSVHKTRSAVGPLKWMAPESLLDKLWSEKTDVWAYGVLTFEVVAREEPYANLEAVQVAAQVCRDGITLDPPTDFGQDIVQLLFWCMSYEAHARPTFQQILDHLNTFN